MSMKDCKASSLQARAAHRRRGLEVGRPVELKRGALAGMSGLLIGFRSERRCLIELDVAQRGVFLSIDCAAVKERPRRQIE
jgi:hypothetical protein